METTILIQKGNYAMVTKSNRIMQRSANDSSLKILVERTYTTAYQTLDMSEYECIMYFKLPVSETIKSVVLQPEIVQKENVDYVQYTYACDATFTKEAGDVDIWFNWVVPDLDENGNDKSIVRKTGNVLVKILPLAAWANIQPDHMMDALDAKLVEVDAKIKYLDEVSETISTSLPVDLEVRQSNLHMITSDQTKIGKGVNLYEDGEEVDGTDNGILEIDKLEDEFLEI
jgi:hypothetical protein